MKGVTITAEDGLTVAPLTAEEARWIGNLQLVLEKCPARLELVTMGDPTLNVVDADGARRSEICDGSALEDGIVLASVKGRPKVHGVS